MTKFIKTTGLLNKMRQGEFYFYHFHMDNSVYGRELIKVWLPLAPESESLMVHILKKNPNCKSIVEPQLSDYFKNKLYIPVATNEVEKKIFLYAQSDTLANSISIIGTKLAQHQLTYLTPKIGSEKADIFFQSKNINYKTYSFSLLKKERPNILLLLNDWSKEAQRIIAHCHLLNIPVICLQESVIDFGDSFKRMQHADEVFVQGSQTVIDLQRKSYFITGNPRYENIAIGKTTGSHVLINCNFTYGIFEDKRDSWLDDINQVLQQENLDYAISQHPRDKGDLSKYKKVIPSSSGSISQQLEESTLLITRFSSLIHEALVMRVPVIYYNPHGETMQYDFEFDGKILQLASNKSELENCIKNFKTLTFDKNYLNEYLARHCICMSSVPSKNIANIISHKKFDPVKFTISDMVKIVLYHPFIKKILSNIRNIGKKKIA